MHPFSEVVNATALFCVLACSCSCHKKDKLMEYLALKRFMQRKYFGFARFCKLA